jgi:hypothetical protein
MQIADLKTRRQESGVRIQNLGFRFQVSGVNVEDSGVRCNPVTRCQVSGVRKAKKAEY